MINWIYLFTIPSVIFTRFSSWTYTFYFINVIVWLNFVIPHHRFTKEVRLLNSLKIQNVKKGEGSKNSKTYQKLFHKTARKLKNRIFRTPFAQKQKR